MQSSWKDESAGAGVQTSEKEWHQISVLDLAQRFLSLPNGLKIYQVARSRFQRGFLSKSVKSSSCIIKERIGGYIPSTVTSWKTGGSATRTTGYLRLLVRAVDQRHRPLNGHRLWLPTDCHSSNHVSLGYSPSVAAEDRTANSFKKCIHCTATQHSPTSGIVHEDRLEAKSPLAKFAHLHGREPYRATGARILMAARRNQRR